MFTVDISKISSLRIPEYLRSRKGIRAEEFNKIVDVCIERMIYIEPCVLCQIVPCDYESYTDRFKYAIRKDKMKWVGNNPRSYNVLHGFDLSTIISSTPMHFIPHIYRLDSITDALVHSTHTYENLLRAYVSARVNLKKIPIGFDKEDVSDEIFELYCQAVRRNIWCICRSQALIKRLILAVNDCVYEALCFNDESCINSYILAHYPTLKEAPLEFVGHAYMLWSYR